MLEWERFQNNNTYKRRMGLTGQANNTLVLGLDTVSVHLFLGSPHSGVSPDLGLVRS